MMLQAIKQAIQFAQQSLPTIWWQNSESVFKERSPVDANKPFCYWWHAHAIDVLLDGYLRTRDDAFLQLAQSELEGVIRKNGGHLLNNWYDDMEWMALALLRMWDITHQEQYKQWVALLWADIQTAWNDNMGGGMAWKKDQLDYKNTPANAPAAILAFRLYQRFRREEDLAWGEKIFNFNRLRLMDPDTHFVWDGLNRLGDGQIDKDWEYTYNQGVMIGAALEYYQITKEPRWLTLSLDIAHESFNHFLKPNHGLLPYEGLEDCGLFRGIYLRYITQLYLAAPKEVWLKDMVEQNAAILSEKGITKEGLIGGKWDDPPQGTVDLAQQLSGIMLLEMAMLMEREKAALAGEMNE